MSSCEGCGSPHVVYRNYKDQALCCPCAMCCPDTESEPALKRQMLGPDVPEANDWEPHLPNKQHDYNFGCDISPKCQPVDANAAPKGPGDSTPSHYQGNGMTPFDVINAFDLDFYEGNLIKYALRWRKKNGVEDLKKAEHYVQILIQRAEAGK